MFMTRLKVTLLQQTINQSLQNISMELMNHPLWQQEPTVLMKWSDKRLTKTKNYPSKIWRESSLILLISYAGKMCPIFYKQYQNQSSTYKILIVTLPSNLTSLQFMRTFFTSFSRQSGQTQPNLLISCQVLDLILIFLGTLETSQTIK